MAVHALWFCADVKTARPLSMAPGGLGVTIERCVKVFAAVEQMTTERFEADIVDRPNLDIVHLLLRSPRVSSQNQSSLGAAIVQATRILAVSQLKADSVLTKSFALGNFRTCFRALCKKSLHPQSAPGSTEDGSMARPQNSAPIPPAGVSSPLIGHPQLSRTAIPAGAPTSEWYTSSAGDRAYSRNADPI